jgi:hypothetical protein
MRVVLFRQADARHSSRKPLSAEDHQRFVRELDDPELATT